MFRIKEGVNYKYNSDYNIKSKQATTKVCKLCDLKR